MPYFTIKDLPDPVRNNLPARAQEIYRKAYNSAYHQYDKEARDESREAFAAKIAWSAVKKEYVKGTKKWVKIGDKRLASNKN
jgi:cation transport regulator